MVYRLDYVPNHTCYVYKEPALFLAVIAPIEIYTREQTFYLHTLCEQIETPVYIEINDVLYVTSRQAWSEPVLTTKVSFIELDTGLEGTAAVLWRGFSVKKMALEDL